MMNRFFSLSFATLILIAGSAERAFSDTEWIEIKDPGTLDTLISGKVVDGKYWIHYYREDGNMATYSDEYKSTTIRKWKIEDDGRICTAVFAKPDRSLGCYEVRQAANGDGSYQLVGSGFTSAFTIAEEAPENVVEALNEAAGPLK